jgi:Putative peptidoglycan binding domain
MKTNFLVGLLAAAALATAPGIALARGGGGGGGGGSHGGGGGSHGGGSFHGGSFHGGNGFQGGSNFHGGNGFHGGSFHGGRGFVGHRFRHDHEGFFGPDFVFGSFGSSYYDPYYQYSAQDYNDVTVAVQQALTQLGYYHGPVDGVVGPQTETAIRWFQSVDRLPVTGQIDSATLRALRIG